MQTERVVAPGEIYRHFKDRIYQVQGVAYNSETGEKCVVYQALYGEYKWYVRPFDMFISEVDHVKYPEVKQKYRFEKVMPEELAKDGDTAATILGETAESGGTAVSGGAAVASGVSCGADNENSGELTDEGVVNPLLLQFLDAKGYREKLNILALVHQKMDERLLGDIAISLDEVLPEGSLEEQFISIKNCVQTHAKYEESNRLRI